MANEKRYGSGSRNISGNGSWYGNGSGSGNVSGNVSGDVSGNGIGGCGIGKVTTTVAIPAAIMIAV